MSHLALGVVEVSRHSNDCALDLSGTKVCLGGLTHLDEDHAGDLLSTELLCLAFVLHCEYKTRDTHSQQARLEFKL